MDNLSEAKNLISNSKNIYIIPGQNTEPDTVASALALFYTLKESGKNVNLTTGEEFSEKLKFLIPSPDFISYPKNFILFIPKIAADISQIYYEKNDQGLKVHLTVDKGIIKKDDISFYFSDSKPDLVVTLGIKDFKEQILKMDSFGFLLDSPILNIDNNLAENKNFGKINLIKESSISETALDLAINLNTESVKKEAATCFLTGIAAYTENFGNSKVNSQTFEAASLLMKKGADLQTIKENLYGNTK